MKCVKVFHNEDKHFTNSHSNFHFPQRFQKIFLNISVHHRLKTCIANTGQIIAVKFRYSQSPYKFEISHFVLMFLSSFKNVVAFSQYLKFIKMPLYKGFVPFLNSLSICPSLVSFESCDHDLLNSTQTDRRDQIENALN